MPATTSPPTQAPLREPATFTYASDDQAPRLARRDVRELLGSWELPDQDEVVLLVFELVTNAIKHTWRPGPRAIPRPPAVNVQVSLRMLDQQRLLVEVHDRDVMSYATAFRALRVQIRRWRSTPPAPPQAACALLGAEQRMNLLESGRGLGILVALAEQIECQLCHDGKVMAAVMVLEAAAPPASTGAQGAR